jgi:hypothetical protein
MSFVRVAPEFVSAAATDVANIGSAISEANAAAAFPTTSVLAAGGDEVSAAIAAVFSTHGWQFQALSAQAAAYHSQFVQALHSGPGTYAAAEGANASPLQALQTVEHDVSGAINRPFIEFTGRPLFGNGANGTTVNGVGTAGGAGGWLFGNGGTGGACTNPGATGGAGGAGGWLLGSGGTGGAGGAAVGAGNGGAGGPGGTAGLLFGTGGTGGTAISGTGGAGGGSGEAGRTVRYGHGRRFKSRKARRRCADPRLHRIAVRRIDRTQRRRCGLAGAPYSSAEVDHAVVWSPH